MPASIDSRAMSPLCHDSVPDSVSHLDEASVSFLNGNAIVIAVGTEQSGRENLLQDVEPPQDASKLDCKYSKSCS